MFSRSKTNLSGGIVGLANVGKSTLFQALTRSQLGNAANYPFATIDPEEGKVAVPSTRLDELALAYKSKRTIPASFQLVDIAGLVRGAASGQGLGNAFLSQIRAVDGLLQVVRCFDDPGIVHVENSVDPVRDAQIIHDELVLKDMEFVLKALEQARKRKSSDTANAYEAALQVLDTGRRIDTRTDWKPTEVAALRPLTLLTTKPSVFVANVSEEDWCFGDPCLSSKALSDWVRDYSRPGDVVVPLSVNLEARLAAADPSERETELCELDTYSDLPRVITSLRQALGLHSFFTAGPEEAREWTVRVGATAPQAAAAIHTDLEKTFINAQVMNFADAIAFGGDEAAVRRAGRLQTRGKDYIVSDGDVLHIRAGAGSKRT